MPYLDKIVSQINTDLLAGPLSNKRFAGGRVENIAVQVKLDYEDKAAVYVPVVYRSSGEYREVTFDDSYPLTIYHRTLSNTYKPIDGQGVGATKRKWLATSQMLMCVMAFRDQIKTDKETLEAAIVTNFPFGNNANYKIAPLQTCIVTVLQTDMDSLAVFLQEFKGVNVELNPEKIIFLVKYKIESTYYEGCFNICD